jgi:hypothetical protein
VFWVTWWWGGTYLSYSAVGNFGIPRTTRAYEIIFSIAAPTVASLIPILYAMTRTGKLREDGDSDIFHQSGRNVLLYYIGKSIVPVLLSVVSILLMGLVYLVRFPDNHAWILSLEFLEILFSVCTMVYLMSSFILLLLLFTDNGLLVSTLTMIPFIAYILLTGIFTDEKLLLTAISFLICCFVTVISKVIVCRRFVNQLVETDAESVVSCDSM